MAKPTPDVTKVSTVCDSSEVIRHISETDGKTEEVTYKSHSETKSESNTVVKKENKTISDIDGTVFIEHTSSANAKKDVIDYSYTGGRSSEFTKISETEFKIKVDKKIKLTGRNGYKFKGPNNTLVDTKDSDTSYESVNFDDGKITYVISEKQNGKDVDWNLNYITTYTSANDTFITRYKVLPVVKNKDGLVTQETLSFEEICTSKKQ